MITHIKSKLFLPILFMLLIVGSVSLITFEHLIKTEQLRDLDTLLKNQTRLFERFTQEKLKIMAGATQMLMVREDIRDALKKKDANQLHSLSESTFELFKKNHVSHLYFIGPDKKVIIRLHELDHSGDLITREGLARAARSGKAQGGIEMGFDANLVLRYTEPVYEKGDLLGYVELGEDLNIIFDDMSYLLDSQVYVLQEIKYIEMQKFQKRIESEPAKYRILGEYAIIASSENDTSVINHQIAQCQNQSEQINGYSHTCHTFKTIKGRPIKIIHSRILSPKAYQDVRSALIQATIIIILISLLLFAFYYRYVLSIEETLRSQHEKLQQSAMTDPLTKLGNRRHLMLLIDEKIASVKRFKVNGYFFEIDIDHFKAYNDHYGHDLGDQALIKIAEILSANVKRGTDLLIRMGGEEFGIFVMFPDDTKAEAYGKKLLTAIQSEAIPHEANKQSGILTVSIGCSCVTDLDSKSFDQLYKEADSALYISKKRGRNTFSLYES